MRPAARLLLVLATVTPIVCVATASCAPATPATTPLAATVAAVESTDLVSALGLTLDSAASTDRVLQYRSSERGLRPLVRLQLTVDADRAVREVQLGVGTASLRAMALLLRDPYAAFVQAVIAPGDSTAWAPLLTQLRSDLLGVANGDFIARDSTVAGMPARPTAHYLAFLNARPVADSTAGTVRIRIETVGIDGDSTTVLTVGPAGGTPTAVASDAWVTRRYDLLGATLAAAREHPVLVALDVDSGERTGSVVRFRRVDERESEPIAELALGAGDVVDTVVLVVPTPSDFDRQMQATFVQSAMLALVPRRDSAGLTSLVGRFAQGTSPGELPGPVQALDAVLAGERPEAELVLQRSVVRLTRPRADAVRIAVSGRG